MATRTIRSGKTCLNLKSKQHLVLLGSLAKRESSTSNNETVEAMLPMHSVISIGQTAADKRWTCDGCQRTFNSSQALGSHKNACDVYKDQMLRSVQGSTTIFAAFTNAPQGSTTAEKQRTLEGGKGTRISRAEKQAWHEEVNVRWQKCAWVDRPVMLEIAKCIVCCSRQGEACW
jgi:hypothetical protein